MAGVIDLRTTAIGALVMLVPGVGAILAVGLMDAVAVLLFSAALGGFVTGWLSTLDAGVRSAMQEGGYFGLHASGLGGIILVAALLWLDVPSGVTDPGPALLVVASPMAIVVYALLGLGGGYVGSGLKIAVERRTNAGA